jgi:hypothetical protein
MLATLAPLAAYHGCPDVPSLLDGVARGDTPPIGQCLACRVVVPCTAVGASGEWCPNCETSAVKCIVTLYKSLTPA